MFKESHSLIYGKLIKIRNYILQTLKEFLNRIITPLIIRCTSLTGWSNDMQRDSLKFVYFPLCSISYA